MSGDIAGAAAGLNVTQEITFEDVVRAGRVLFGPAFAVEASAWRADLRAVYRRRAMETHPDRARALGRSELELSREFRAVADAYRVLSELKAGPIPELRPAPAAAGPRPRRSPSPPPTPAPPARPRESATHRPPPRAAPAAPPRQSSRPEARVPASAPRVRVAVRPEEMPRRRLRFAEYLYYSGRICWSELVEAVAWQRRQRPPIGRIAIELGFLLPDDIGVILERRREAGANATPFGEWAVRLGYLSPFQLLALVGQQLRLQRPIGQYFVEAGILEPEEIDEVRRRILRHNSRVAR